MDDCETDDFINSKWNFVEEAQDSCQDTQHQSHEECILNSLGIAFFYNEDSCNAYCEYLKPTGLDVEIFENGYSKEVCRQLHAQSCKSKLSKWSSCIHDLTCGQLELWADSETTDCRSEEQNAMQSCGNVVRFRN